jgi:hypothetical protein
MKNFLMGLAVASGVAAGAFGMPAPARAGVDIDIIIRPDILIAPWRGHLSCRAAAREVWYRDFRAISALDCHGSVYAYRARKNHRWHVVRVLSRNGRILSVN